MRLRGNRPSQPLGSPATSRATTYLTHETSLLDRSPRRFAIRAAWSAYFGGRARQKLHVRHLLEPSGRVHRRNYRRKQSNLHRAMEIIIKKRKISLLLSRGLESTRASSCNRADSRVLPRRRLRRLRRKIARKILYEASLERKKTALARIDTSARRSQRSRATPKRKKARRHATTPSSTGAVVGGALRA